MTDKSKPWLAAKTAGDALLDAHAHVSHKGYASWCDFEAACVIEWHEAQRVKVSERWEVEQYGRRVSGVVFATSKLAHLSARINDRVTVVKVTRYRRKGARGAAVTRALVYVSKSACELEQELIDAAVAWRQFKGNAEDGAYPWVRLLSAMEQAIDAVIADREATR